MNKIFVAFFVVAVSASYGFFIDNLPFKCKENKDCGAHKCCGLGGFCFPKLGANRLCGGSFNFNGKCDCLEGLECKVTKEVTVNIGGKEKKIALKQCKAADEEVVPDEIEYDEEKNREKRLLFGSAIDAIKGVVTGGVNKLVPKCSVNSDCGAKRCCLNSTIFNKPILRCLPSFGYLSPCSRNPHCCEEGLECRSAIKVSSATPDRPDKTHVDLKLCLKASDPVVPPIEVDE